MSHARSSGQPLKVIEGHHIQAASPISDATVRDAVARAAFALLTPEQMAEVAVSRAFIERAKGMLMLVYDVDADNAFELLKFGSQNTNVKLRALAKRLTEDLAGLAQRQPQTMRSVCDEVLFSTSNPPRPPPEVG